MGKMLRAACKCGFELPFNQGGGSYSFKEVDSEPAYCSNCNRMIITNCFSKRPRCPKCRRKVVFLNDLSLCQNRDPPLIQWGEFMLPSKGCLCPSCGEYALEFIEEGCWD